MATKNLARTVIEGGRTRYSKHARRHSNRRIRRAVRTYTDALRFALDPDERPPAPVRPQVARGHRDRLAPAQRWLASFVGRPWNEARAELARRFDDRTIAGHHIVHDHLLRSVQLGACTGWCGHDFVVDGAGVLRHLDRGRRRPARRVPAGKVRRRWAEVHAWSRERRVGRRGAAWFWFEPTALGWVACADRGCWRGHRVDGGVRRHRAPTAGFRQSHRLAPADVVFWERLLDEVQARLRVTPP